jgi:hypothetical protein
MKVTLSEILKQVAIECGIISSYSESIPADKKIELIEFVNDTKEEVAWKVELASLITDLYIKTEAEYSTGTAAITQGTVDVVGTTTVITAAMVGRKIQIGSDANVYKIATRTDDTHFTINRPFLGTTETAGAISIIKDIYDMPPEIWKFLFLHDDQNGYRVWERPAKWVMRMLPDPFDHTGTVFIYGEMGARQVEESVTASAATTTTVTATSPAGDYDDYYKGWYLYNANRAKTVRVKKFVVATGVLTLEEAIPGQVKGDTMTLKNPIRQIIVRDVETASLYWRGIGLVPPTKLVNDEDIEFEIPEYYAGNVLKMGTRLRYKRLYGMPTDTQMILLLENDYQKLLQEIKGGEEKQINRTYQFGRTRRPIENRFKGGGWPADQF